MLRIKTLTLTYITFGIAFFILGAIIILNTIIEGFSSLIYSILLIICLTFVLISSFLFLTARTGAKPKSKKRNLELPG